MVDAFAVVIDGLRLVWRHLPTLLAIYLIGAAGRAGTIWASVNLSNSHPFLAQLLLPLAPLCSLVAMILMIRAVVPSLRFVEIVEPTPSLDDVRPKKSGWFKVNISGTLNARLGLLASVLIPFLTVYSAQGFLEADRRSFINSTMDAEFNRELGATGAADPNRFVVGTGAFLLGLIIVAFVLRRLINEFDLAEKHTSVGLFAGYLEVFWLFALATAAGSLVDRFSEWRDTRVFTVTVVGWWENLIGWLGPIGTPIKAVVDWISSILTQSTDLIIVPIAWLTVGAVVLGRTGLGDSDAADAAGSGDAPADRWRKRVREQARIDRIPGPVRRLGAKATADIRDRFASFFKALRLLITAGLIPMVMFCVVFMVARGVQWGVGEVIRAMRGPVDYSTGISFAPWVSLASSAAYTVFLTGLLAAAVDRITQRIRTTNEALAVDTAASAETAPTNPAT